MGLDQHTDIGARLRAARRRRGMSLRTLAGLAGVSTSWLSMVENGHRHLDRASVINALADALRIAPSDLLGHPYPAAGPGTATTQAAIPELRVALMTLQLATPPDAPPPAQPHLLRDRVAEANRLYHACQYATLAAALPGLLTDLHTALAHAPSGQRPDLLRLLAGTYHPACVLLLKYLGYPDLAFLAVLRASEAIAELDDPLYEALSGFFRAHVLIAAGNPAQALAHADTAADQVERHLHGAAAHALLGELHLMQATCQAGEHTRSGTDRAEAVRAHLTEAEKLAGITGEMPGTWHLNFGPTNVAIHHVTLNTDLGRHAHAAAAADRLATRLQAPAGRAAAFHADHGRALAHLRDKATDAVHALLTAEHLAPQRIHANALTRATVSSLLGRRLPAHAARELRALAHRMGLQT